MSTLPGANWDMRESPIFVGRDQELDALQHAFQRASSGNGGLALIGGEAGIGKTSLVEQFLGEVDAESGIVLHGYCYDLSTPPPYGAWLELTDRYRSHDGLPPLPEVLKRGTGVGNLQSQVELFEVARDFFESLSAVRPVVIVLEDIHWSDQASLDLLRFLARHLDAARILIVATYRDDELSRQHPLFALLPTIVREARAIRIEPGTLDRRDVQQLVAGRWSLPRADEDRLIDLLLNYAEGNPLFTVEVLRSLEQNDILRLSDDGWVLDDITHVPVPALVQQVIELRLSRLDEHARHFLEMASVIGHEVEFTTGQSVAGISDDELLTILDQAIALHILEQSTDGRRMRFVHALTREALYRTILLPRRRVWHRLIAETIAGYPTAIPDTVAFHFQRANDPRAVDWLVRAGEWAERTFAWRIAVDRYRTASELLQHDQDRLREQGWLRYRTARLGLFLDPAAAVADLEHSMRIASRTGDKVLHAASTVRRGHFLGFVGEFKQGLDEIARGVTAWDELSLDEKLACEYADVCGSDLYVNIFRGTWLLLTCGYGMNRKCLEVAETFLPEMEAVRERLIAERHIYWLDGYVGIAMAQSRTGRPEDARETLESARDGFAAINVPVMESFSSGMILSCVHIPYQTEQLADRRRLVAEMDDAWDRSLGAIRPEMSARLQHVNVMAIEGEWDEVIDIGTHGIHWHANVGRQIELRAAMGPVARNQGKTDLAWEQIDAILTDGPETEPGVVGRFHELIELVFLGAALNLDSNDFEGARVWLECVDRWLEWSDDFLGQSRRSLLWAQYALLASDVETARKSALEALELASDPRQPPALISAHRFLGELAVQTGDLEVAEAHINASLDLATKCAIPFDRALALLAGAELELKRGDHDAARSLLSEVRRIASDLGAAPTLERVEHLAAGLSSSPGGARSGLSSRELEVLKLITRGMSDKEIADELFISHYTVMRHVSSILRKFDVHSRTAAATRAVRDGLI